MMISVEIALDVLGAAVDRAASRHSLHVANIANAAVPGYQRAQTEFTSLLPSDAGVAEVPDLAAGVNLAHGGTQVRVDQEMAMMAENAVRYQILLGAFDYTLGLLRSAAREGR